MFRWVKISLETLKRIKFLLDFKKALGRLPSELAGLYNIIHLQIERTESHRQKVAIRTLNWLLYAQRLLFAEELISAIYVLDDDTSLDSDEDTESKSMGSPKDDILRLCRNLIIFDSEQEIFRFAHQSVREYLIKLSRYTIVEQHALAVKRCLEIYLTGSRENFISGKEKRQNTILKPYAEVYWPVHYKYAENSTSVELKNKFSRFTDPIQGMSPPYVEWRSDILQKYGDHRWGMKFELRLGEDDHLSDRIIYAAHHPNTLLGVASAFGLLSFLEAHQPSSAELNEYLDIDSATYTLLSFAAREGHNQVLQLLLDKGADVNALEALAVQEAVLWGQTQILETLLDQRSIDTNDLPRVCTRYLSVACSNGNVSTVRLLLERGADVNARGGDYDCNPLEAASYEGHDGIVQLLLDYGADVNDLGGPYGGALHGALQMASLQGWLSTAQLLLDRGADVNASSAR